jgi:CxxC motif-containing protein (DUF1111 family)
MLLLLGLGVLYCAWPGMPVWWAPRASAEMAEAGRELFEREWKVNDPAAGGDGLGPVFNATSCAACHFQGGVGGGGPNQHNVLVFEAAVSRTNPKPQSGLIHRFAIAPDLRETHALARRLFPIERGRQQVIEGCTVTIPDFDPLRTENINTTALFGAGWIERISERNINHQQARKALEKIIGEFQLDFSGVRPGRAHVLADGRIGKFGWRGQFATLAEFVAAACANELGLGSPLMEQARPLARTSYPAVKPDLDRAQFDALVAFVDTLPRPIEIMPGDAKERAAAERGKAMFLKVGCAICHVPELAGIEGIYSDLLLHEVEDRSSGDYANQAQQLAPPREGAPRPNEWKTPPLWGVADSAPYFHDGGAATLEQAILRHRADALSVTTAYRALPGADQQALIAFLRTLKAPTESLAAKR